MKKRRTLVNLLLLIVVLMIVLGLLETVLRLSGRRAETEDKRYREELARLARRTGEGGEIKSPYMLLHPYFGYTNVPGTVSVHDQPINNLGFAAPVDFPYRKMEDDEYVISVFGGSVAEILTVRSAPTLVDVLKENPLFSGRKITVLNCATGAYKQPQQLLILTYLLSQGMDIDCVVNIDGFNEVAIASVNRKKGVNIYYPAAFYWDEMIDYLTSGTEGLLNNPRYLELVYQRRRCLERQQAILTAILESPARHSALSRFILSRWLGVVSARRAAVEEKLKTISRGEATAWVERMKRGPVRGSDLESAAANWRRCSELMGEICDAAAVLYLQVLQPNQYDPRGKKLGEKEREVAYNPTSPFRKGAEWGYPLLREEARRLDREKVRFLDLSLIFNRLEEDIYVDDCCHFNQLGNDLLMEEIGKAILEEEARGKASR